MFLDCGTEAMHGRGEHANPAQKNLRLRGDTAKHLTSSQLDICNNTDKGIGSWQQLTRPILSPLHCESLTASLISHVPCWVNVGAAELTFFWRKSCSWWDVHRVSFSVQNPFGALADWSTCSSRVWWAQIESLGLTANTGGKTEARLQMMWLPAKGETPW